MTRIREERMWAMWDLRLGSVPVNRLLDLAQLPEYRELRNDGRWDTGRGTRAAGH